MRAYHRLTEGERNQVYALKKAGLPQRASTRLLLESIRFAKNSLNRKFKARIRDLATNIETAHRASMCAVLVIVVCRCRRDTFLKRESCR